MKYLHHLLLAASAANAHSIFQQLWVGAEDKGVSCARVPRSNSPVTSLGGAELRCNAGPARANAICSVDAGESLTVEMHPQPGGERKCGKDSAIGGNHYGPVIVYMSKVANAATADGSSDWFKIAEDGLDPKITTTDAWGTNVSPSAPAFPLPPNVRRFQLEEPSGRLSAAPCPIVSARP